MASPSGSQQASQPSIPGLGAATNVHSTEDFTAQMDVESAGGAGASADTPGPNPTATTTTTSAAQQPQQQSQQQNDNDITVEPGRMWSSESVSLFNNLCIKNAVVADFQYAQVRATPPGWAVVLRFGFGMINGDADSFTVDLPGPYTSKKEAKAAAAEEGLKVLTEAVERRSLKRKQPGGSEGEQQQQQQQVRESSDDENENWIGLLGEYCQAEGIPRPMFQEFSLGANFSMECTLASLRPDAPFGGRNALFSSKKAAKANAAREAVRWLRDGGYMPRKGHPTKKRARAAAQQAALQAGPVPLTPAPAAAAAGPVPEPIPISGGGGGGGGAAAAATPAAAAAPGGAGSGSETEDSGSGNPEDRSPGEQVMMLCSKLGCAQPIYRITPDPRLPSMWSGAAYFPYDPSIAAAGQGIGEIKSIYGKKKAREEVAKRVLKHLKAKRAERQRDADVVMAGAAGAGAAVGEVGSASVVQAQGIPASPPPAYEQ